MDQELDVGARLGRYRVDALVGEGGMGRVWRAYDEKLQRYVALELLHRGEQDILAEARVAATLEHSGVVAIFDVVDDERVPFIVEAHEALAALGPGMSPPRFVPDQLLIVDSARVYLLAGQVERAVELLREATASCLASNDPLRFVQAHALLGLGLEALGDHEGACAAYAFVDARWGRVEGSRTAALARARMDALDCRA